MSECKGMDQDHYTGLDVMFCFFSFLFSFFFHFPFIELFSEPLKIVYFSISFSCVLFCFRKCFECCSRQMLPPKKKKYIEISQVTVSRIQRKHTHRTVVGCLKDSCQLTTL